MVVEGTLSKREDEERRVVDVDREDDEGGVENRVDEVWTGRDDDIEEVTDSFCAEGAFRSLGLRWRSTYTNVCCLSWPELRERRWGDDLLSFILVLPGIASPLEGCLELI